MRSRLPRNASSASTRDAPCTVSSGLIRVSVDSRRHETRRSSSPPGAEAADDLAGSAIISILVTNFPNSPRQRHTARGENGEKSHCASRKNSYVFDEAQKSGSLTLVRGCAAPRRRGSAGRGVGTFLFLDCVHTYTRGRATNGKDIHIDCIFARPRRGNNANLVSRNGHQRAVGRTVEHTVAPAALMPRFCPPPSSLLPCCSTSSSPPRPPRPPPTSSSLFP